MFGAFPLLAIVIFGLAAVLALSITWSTVSGHAIRFARTRPSRALRYE